MKIMHTMATEARADRPTRRSYSPAFKARVRQECRQSGTSVASVALSHGINANIVHRWLRQPTATAMVPQSQSQANAFVTVTLNDPAPSPAPHAEPDIRVEVQRANSAIVVKWPM